MVAVRELVEEMPPRIMMPTPLTGAAVSARLNSLSNPSQVVFNEVRQRA